MGFKDFIKNNFTHDQLHSIERGRYHFGASHILPFYEKYKEEIVDIVQKTFPNKFEEFEQLDDNYDKQIRYFKLAASIVAYDILEGLD